MSSRRHFTHEKNYIYWCKECSLPLLAEECGICSNKGEKIELSQPGDIRFCSPYEREIIGKILEKSYGCNPLEKKIVLLNKIPGEDKTHEIIADGHIFGILRFDMKALDWRLDLRIWGAKILLGCSAGKKKTVKIAWERKHLSGKTISVQDIIEYTPDIARGDDILVIAGKNLTGCGAAYISSHEFKASCAALKIKKIDSTPAIPSQRTPGIEEVVRANSKAMKRLVKNAVNTIHGIANQEKYRELPIYVSFSGGKDSLVVLDLTRKAIQEKRIQAFFANTGIEFPETVEFARNYCKENNIEFKEVSAEEAFWENLPKFGPPAKDFRWCCKVCKLAPINKILEDCVNITHKKCLTIDGKRKYESFTRARIAPMEENPFIPNQLSVFPIRDWRAIEVWLYIYYRKLKYNPLYDLGFERVGCWLCPAELSAEHLRFRDLHPDLYEKWYTYLEEWAQKHGLSKEYVKHGLWRWKTLPPKMKKLSEELNINTVPLEVSQAFSIQRIGGISPCKAGGYNVEGTLKGLLPQEARNIMRVIGTPIFSEELGVLLVKTSSGTLKMFSSSHISVNAMGKKEALTLFELAAKQIVRLIKCTKCGVCVKTCPNHAISLNDKIVVNEKCTHCGKCTESCVAAKYFYKLVPDFAYPVPAK